MTNEQRSSVEASHVLQGGIVGREARPPGGKTGPTLKRPPLNSLRKLARAAIEP